MRAVIPFLLAAVGVAIAAPPNIVVIVSDDQGFNDVSFHGGEIKTPAIDRIAQEGVELDRFYVCPVCSPTRAGLLTGRYAIRFGMQRGVNRPWLETGIPEREETLAEMLGRAGYENRAAVGKWHVGHSRKRHHPLRQGFTSFYGHYNGYVDYFTHFRDTQLDWHRGFETNRDEGYSTDLIAGEAARFIERHASEPPFFLYVPFNAPHLPLQAPDRWVDANAHIADRDRRVYAGMVSAMDAGVGRILDALDATGVANDTLVWFTSDNGGVYQLADNGSLRAGKGTVYEGGIRVAAAFRWPNGVEGGGRKVTEPLHYLDIWPTLRRVAGVKGSKGRPLDGIDALDIIRGKEKAPVRPLFSFYDRYGAESLALIEGDWKLVRIGPPILGMDPADRPPAAMAANVNNAPLTVELFNLADDPGEKTDLAARHPDRVRDLLTKVKEFRLLRPKGGTPPMGAPAPEGFMDPPNWEITKN